jgi:hypothetical protein
VTYAQQQFVLNCAKLIIEGAALGT